MNKPTNVVVIDHQKYGGREEFSSLATAVAALNVRGFAVALHQIGDVVFDQGSTSVGSIIEMLDAASWEAAYRDEVSTWLKANCPALSPERHNEIVAEGSGDTYRVCLREKNGELLTATNAREVAFRDMTHYIEHLEESCDLRRWDLRGKTAAEIEALRFNCRDEILKAYVFKGLDETKAVARCKIDESDQAPQWWSRFADGSLLLVDKDGAFTWASLDQLDRTFENYTAIVEALSRNNPTMPIHTADELEQESDYEISIL